MSVGDNKSMRLSILDDFMVEEILAAEGDATAADGEALRRDIERAELLARKSRLKALREEIDKERSTSSVVQFDSERMRAKLKAIGSAAASPVTMAARSGNTVDDDDLNGLLEDLAELEQDSEARDNE
ncbi:hypothetical protein [Sphingobium aquiterrae]|uniref:hypothetical protein n=1 Tax=Sphingobium aquiterrae TaxID=2038656 RepID=UPI003017602D